MTVITVRPDATISNGASVINGGAASRHAALNDDSDTTYLTWTSASGARIGCAEPSPAAGAALKAVSVRSRHKRVTPDITTWQVSLVYNGLIIETDVNEYASTIINTTVDLIAVLDEPYYGAIADLEIQIVPYDPHTNYNVYEAYVDFIYVVLPVTDVLTPADGGTITTANRPEVTWSNTLDADGGVQTAYQVKIFNDAQYLAGGFDPDTSTPYEDSEELSGSDTSWSPSISQVDDVYRAYVRVGQTVAGSTHWGDWAFNGYTVDVDIPATPTMTLTAENQYGRVKIALDDNDGAAQTDMFLVEYSDDGGTTWDPVRTLDGDGFEELAYVIAVGTFSDSADGTTHNANLPAPTGGILEDDLLIAVASFDGNPTVGWPSDWTEIKDEAGNGSAVRVACAYKWALGGEIGTIAVTTSASEGGGVRILCVRNADESTAPAISTGANGSASNSGNPDSLNPSGWDVEQTLWIACMGNDGDVAVTAAPTNYVSFGNTRWANASGAGVATAYRRTQAASEDPGTFTHAAEDNRAFTIGVRPDRALPVIYDYEAPNGVTRQYRAFAIHNYDGLYAYSATSASGSTSWTDADQWWLKHPNYPGLNMAITLRSQPGRSRAGRRGIFYPLGSKMPRTVNDVRGGDEGEVVFRLASADERERFDELLDATTSAYLLQGPASAEWRDHWLSLGDLTAERALDTEWGPYTFEGFDWAEVDRPIGAVIEWDDPEPAP